MPKVVRNGVELATFPTRAECLVFVFEQHLVYDSHSRMRNRLLPGVKVVGKDYEEEQDATDWQRMVLHRMQIEGLRAECAWTS